jgi:hypothetical protein
MIRHAHWILLPVGAALIYLLSRAFTVQSPRPDRREMSRPLVIQIDLDAIRRAEVGP